MKVSVCGSIRNFIGKDGSQYVNDWKGDFIPVGAKENRNEYRKTDNLRGIYFFSNGVPQDSPAYGTMALVTQATDGVSHRLSSTTDSWNNAILDFWDDFSADGELNIIHQPADQDPMASLSVKKTILPHTTETFSFFLTWCFPNRNRNLTISG